jgi:hypothetical protein
MQTKVSEGGWSAVAGEREAVSAVVAADAADP